MHKNLYDFCKVLRILKKKNDKLDTTAAYKTAGIGILIVDQY